MTRAERAKQFAPFSPLTGLSLALSDREKALSYSRELYIPDDTPVVLQKRAENKSGAVS